MTAINEVGFTLRQSEFDDLQREAPLRFNAVIDFHSVASPGTSCRADRHIHFPGDSGS